MIVLVQKWLESERGWGQRPDGYSIHRNQADLDAYIEEYWAGMPKECPDTYSRPCGNPYPAEVKGVRLGKKKGLRFWSNNIPKGY